MAGVFDLELQDDIQPLEEISDEEYYPASGSPVNDSFYSFDKMSLTGPS